MSKKTTRPKGKSMHIWFSEYDGFDVFIHQNEKFDKEGFILDPWVFEYSSRKNDEYALDKVKKRMIEYYQEEIDILNKNIEFIKNIKVSDIIKGDK